ncbi:MAG: serine/threonine-protein kinase [Chloroflexota bacterium]
MPEASVLNNRYRIEERLATGGMAVIYRAYDLMLERMVAIKILRSDFSNTHEFHERFRQEARSAANLSHPNIVTIHDFGVVSQANLGLGPNLPYIVMEYVPGTDLKTLLKQQGRFSIPETIALISQACAGIGYAHRAGLVHCDVKPQNLLVTPESHLKVLDFGIARALATISEDEHSDIVWGSPQYFSPEQAAGLAPSPASDVYSLGVILFELLTGQLPFSGTTPQELAQHHRYTPPPSPSQLNPAIPSPLEQILLKVLSKEPTSRYRTADQLGRVLINYNQYAIWPTTPTPGSPVQNKVGAVPAGVQPSADQPFPPQSLPQPDLEPPLVVVPRRAAEKFDWVTWLLALLALIAAGGLIPFWLWVIYHLNPPL